MIYLFSVVIGNKGFENSFTFGLIAIWTGVFLLLGVSIHSWTMGGLLLGVAAGLSFSLYVWGLQQVPSHPLGKLYIVLISFILTFVTYIFFEFPISFPRGTPLFYGFITALLGQITTFELLAYSAVRIPPTLIAVLITLELPMAVSFSWIIWGPSPTLLNIIGLLLMVGAVGWIKYNQDKKDFCENAMEKDVVN